ncbi:MAG: hypothetical protein ACI8W8_003437 [Rhodothermales bacterium]|jgi:hypothetical protein
MPVRCLRILGQIPPIPPRRVAFFANLQSIFFDNSEETAVLSTMVHGIPSYGGRLLPVLNLLYPGSDNLLVLERDPAPDILAWFRDELGLDLPPIATLAHHDYLAPKSPRMAALRTQLEAHPAPWLDGYVTDRRLCEIAAATQKQTRSCAGASQRGNNKYQLHCFLEANDLPVFDSEVAESANEVAPALARLRARGYRHACLKAAIGASGIGLRKVATDAPVATVEDFFFGDDPCLVQGWLDERSAGVTRIESPSVQLWLDDDWLAMYDLTSQILSAESIHEGNFAPPAWQASCPDLVNTLLAQAEVAATWLHGQGYRGAASIDYHVTWDAEERPEVRICEINARVTGATYPSLLARKLAPANAWRMQNLHFPSALPCATLLDALCQAQVAFRPGDENGFVPINANLMADGLVEKCQLLALAPTSTGCLALLERLEHILPVEFLHDRD